MNECFCRAYKETSTQLVPMPRVRSGTRLTIAAAGWCLTKCDSQASPVLPRLLGKQEANTDKEPDKCNGGPTVNSVRRGLTVLKRGLICSEGSSISPVAGLIHNVSYFFFPVSVWNKPAGVTLVSTVWGLAALPLTTGQGHAPNMIDSDR